MYSITVAYTARFAVCLIVCFWCHLEPERKCCVGHLIVVIINIFLTSITGHAVGPSKANRLK